MNDFNTKVLGAISDSNKKKDTDYTPDSYWIEEAKKAEALRKECEKIERMVQMKETTYKQSFSL